MTGSARWRDSLPQAPKKKSVKPVRHAAAVGHLDLAAAVNRFVTPTRWIMPGIDIDVVSDGPDDSGTELSQSMLQAIRSALPDAIVARGVNDMVVQISRRLNGSPIHRLRIYGHGVPGQVWLGCGRARPWMCQHVLGVDGGGQGLNDVDLRRIRGLFAADGFVTIHGCNFAQGPLGRKALHFVSSIWSVVVRASAAAQWAQLAGNLAVTNLQPPVLTARNITAGAIPETPITVQWQ
jgi:hypothetical protein